MSESKTKYKIVCSIVLYETDQKTLERVIKSIYYSKLDNILICLIDNSRKKTIYIDELILKYPEIKYFYNKNNFGYGYANNQIMSKFLNETEFFLVINPDVEFNNDVLHELYSYMSSHKEIGLCGVKILDPEQGIQYANKRLPTPLNVSVRFFGNKIPIFGKLIKILFKKSRDYYKLKDLDNNKNILCPAISGCFMFFRASVLKDVGGVDTRFFMYYDDVDLTRRVFKKYKVILYNKTFITHAWQRGSYKKFHLMKEHIKSTFKYFNKWGWFFDKDRKEFNKKATNLND